MPSKKVRYAVVGLGHIAQVAVLPAFEHAKKNSELAALVSGDQTKLKKLGKKHGVAHQAGYGEYDQLLRSGEIDAVYIALPNDQHREYTVRAAEAGIHVLVEKPMAVTPEECEAMIAAAERNNVRLMVAYRLHFERANLEAIELLKKGDIGEPRYFNSSFSMDVRAGDIRLRKHEEGGGSLYDIGVYCINAARYLFRDEPIEVSAMAASRDDQRFKESEEMIACTMRFPKDRLASFVVSFGASDTAVYQVVGTKGDLRLESAYEYAMDITRTVTRDGKSREKTFPKRDQFAPELIYFSDCVLEGRDPEPSGTEGMNDVRIVQALYESARSGKVVRLEGLGKERGPSMRQEIRRPAVDHPPKPVHTSKPSR